MTYKQKIINATKAISILIPTLLYFPIYGQTQQSTEDINLDTDSNSCVIDNVVYQDKEATTVTSGMGKEKKPVRFAIKTNLLYDLLLTPNIELEVPISKHWSIAGEWIFPWWIIDDGTPTSSRCRLQLLNGNIEGKFWFGNRELRPAMTGWYCGLYSGAGLYDVEYKKSGYQGEFFIAAGLSSGYAHTINKCGSLRMEYSLGFGYLKTKYRHYEAVWGTDNVWHPIRETDGTYTWMGPTRVRISLAWMVGNKNNTKEKKRIGGE